MNNEACEIFINLICLAIRLMPIFICMEPKVKNKENIAAISVNIWVIMIFLQFLLDFEMKGFSLFQGIFSAIFFLVLLVFFKGSALEKAFLYVTAWLFSETTFSINEFFVWLLDSRIQLTRMEICVLSSVLWAFIVYLFIFFNAKTAVKLLFEEFSLRRCTLLIMFPVIALVLLYTGKNTIFSEESLRTIGTEMIIFYLLLNIMVVLAHVLILNSILGLLKRREAEEKLQFAKQMISQQNDHYNRILEYSEQVRIIKHDFRHHIYALLNMEKEEQTSYLKKLQKEMDSTTGLIFCQNVSVNGLIHGYATRTKKINVRLNVNLSLPDRVPIDDLSLCIVIGNLLENALEACKRFDGDDKFISLKGRWMDDHLILLVENSYRGQIMIKEGKLLSSKKSGGLGILSIKKVLNHPGDEFDIDYNENTFTAMVKMMSRTL
ncbi:MAG: GHKL domain-containing protein [Schaedlerella sp.]|nr:GHKL domain-containing protein [Schaedlerella sp.]